MFIYVSALQPPQGMGQRMRFFYFSGNCQSSKGQIQQNFIAILDLFLRNDGGCSHPGNARVCDAKKVEVTCGKTQVVNGRFRRSSQVQHYYYYIIEEIIN